MASSTAKVMFRLTVVILLLLVLFYVGRPLYWKISATVHDIRENKQTVKQGISQFVLDAQKSVGWYHDESDSGILEDRVGTKVRSATSRRLFGQVVGFKEGNAIDLLPERLGGRSIVKRVMNSESVKETILYWQWIKMAAEF